MSEIAVAVVLFVVVFPLLKILIGLAVVGPLTFGRKLPGANALYRLFDKLHPWAMMEIFLLGVLVAYTKLVDLATVEFGPSLIAFVAPDPGDDRRRLRRSIRTTSGRGCPALRGCGCPTAANAGSWSAAIRCQLVCRLPRRPSER